MTYNIVILPSAIQDLDAIFEYYYSISKQALESFKRQFDKTVKVLKFNPFFLIRYNDIRVISIKKFPYVIFFRINPYKQTVYIVAVFNTNQNTDKYPL
ncbi:MAG: type II toxin-antitoxin system RelE/ParE family toxin [Flavobacteriaceae bacterium]|jgi:mRNA-degrading endonuclease RelE of RelBE toxin-antitoxin system|nr:type II toxin-antitoxin system RelE/ParE family toxin [Flavobacteriaceae bacterium]